MMLMLSWPVVGTQCFVYPKETAGFIAYSFFLYNQTYTADLERLHDVDVELLNKRQCGAWNFATTIPSEDKLNLGPPRDKHPSYVPYAKKLAHMTLVVVICTRAPKICRRKNGVMACVKFGMRRAKIKQRDAKVVASNIAVSFAAVRDTRRT